MANGKLDKGWRMVRDLLSRPQLGGLSARLLALTGAFVSVVLIGVLAVTLSEFQERWLSEHVRQAEIASLAVDVAPSNKVSRLMSAKLLEGAGVEAVAVRIDGVRRLFLAPPWALKTPDFVPITGADYFDRLVEPWITLLGAPDRTIRTLARPKVRSGEFVEIVVPAEPLKQELSSVLLRNLLIATVFALIAGGLLYFALSWMIVRPMGRLTRSIERFRHNPQTAPDGRVAAGRRHDEIGRVETEFLRMQSEVSQALRSQAHLAALGQAVAKINHDLRNMLSSAQLASERLSDSGDPLVAKVLPRLERALDRAITLASNVLAYGKTEEAAPVKRRLGLVALLLGAGEDAGLSKTGVRLRIEAVRGFKVDADPEQLHRIFVNLFKNARQAIEAEPDRGGKGSIIVSAARDDAFMRLRINDDGPGLPQKAKAHLFQPFAGGARQGGVGLGLVIARELAQAHGGDLVLLETGPDGTVFEIRLPVAEAPLEPAAAIGQLSVERAERKVE